MAKKTLRFDVDEDHTGFEKVKVKPTKAFSLNDIDDEESFLLLTSKQLEQKLKNENLTTDQVKLIRSILSSRK